jgi:hypothetical protein
VLTAAFWNENVRDNLAEIQPMVLGTTVNYSSSLTFTNLTKGNGTVTAFYQQVGKWVWYFGRFDWGSTTSATGTTTTISLPLTASAQHTVFTGSVNLVDSGTRGFVGVIRLASTTTALITHTESGNFGDMNGTNPFTWTTNDFFIWSIQYIAA